MPLKILKKAIELQQNISFDYKNEGERIGNPHAVYNHINKNRTKSVKVDIEQTSGFSSGQKPFSSFRQFDLDELSNVKLENDEFNISGKYNSKSGRYNDAIIKL